MGGGGPGEAGGAFNKLRLSGIRSALQLTACAWPPSRRREGLGVGLQRVPASAPLRAPRRAAPPPLTPPACGRGTVAMAQDPS